MTRLGRPLATPPPGSLAERIRQRRLAIGIASQDFADADCAAKRGMNCNGEWVSPYVADHLPAIGWPTPGYVICLANT